MTPFYVDKRAYDPFVKKISTFEKTLYSKCNIASEYLLPIECSDVEAVYIDNSFIV